MYSCYTSTDGSFCLRAIFLKVCWETCNIKSGIFGNSKRCRLLDWQVTLIIRIYWRQKCQAIEPFVPCKKIHRRTSELNVKLTWEKGLVSEWYLSSMNTPKITVNRGDSISATTGSFDHSCIYRLLSKITVWVKMSCTLICDGCIRRPIKLSSVWKMERKIATFDQPSSK